MRSRTGISPVRRLLAEHPSESDRSANPNDRSTSIARVEDRRRETEILIDGHVLLVEQIRPKDVGFATPPVGTKPSGNKMNRFKQAEVAGVGISFANVIVAETACPTSAPMRQNWAN